MVWVKFIKHFWKSKVSFYNLELLPFSSSLLLLSEQICCEPLIWSWLAWGYLVFCVALNEYNKDKKIDALSVFFFVCLFFQHHGQWLFPPRWSPGDLATFTSFFTPADRAGASQPCGITVPPVWDKMDFFFSQLEDFFQCYLLSGWSICLWILGSLGWDTASFRSLWVADDVGVKYHQVELVWQA